MDIRHMAADFEKMESDLEYAYMNDDTESLIDAVKELAAIVKSQQASLLDVQNEIRTLRRERETE